MAKRPARTMEKRTGNQVQLELVDVLKKEEPVKEKLEETVTAKEKVVEEKVEAAAVEVKEEMKKVAETTKKAVAKKTATRKKTTAPKQEKKKEPAVYVQFANNEVMMSDVVERAKAAYIAEGHRESGIKSLNLYVKPEENAAYYVINEKASGKVDLF